MSNLPSSNPANNVASYWDGEQWVAFEGNVQWPTAWVSDGHVYLSTACLHQQHDHCNSMVGTQGEKRPAQCKFCEAKCICGCHGEGT